MTDYMGRPVVVNAPRDVPGIVAPPLDTSAIIFPVAGRDGTSISIGGTVATYAELPVLGAGDRGTLYVVQADGLGYVWSGTAWPADGTGIEIRGEKGDRGLGIAAVAVVGDTLRLTMTDGSIETVAVPALEAAAQSALAAAESATLAGQHRQAAADSAQAAADDAALIEATVPYIVQYREDALTAAVEAGASELAAEGSATLAGQHKTAALGHATDAADSAILAHDDQVLAAQHKTGAEAARGDALAAAGDAGGHATEAALSAASASTDAARAEAAADSAEIGAPDGGWLKADLSDEVVQQLPMSVYYDPETGDIDTDLGPGFIPIPDFITAFSLITGPIISEVGRQVADVVGAAPETLDTLEEIAQALGGNPNLAHDLLEAIGLRAKSADVTAALALKASITAMQSRPAMWIWSGTGTWTPPSGAVATDTVLNLDTGDLHTIGEL